jgi:hypothetical protein
MRNSARLYILLSAVLLLSMTGCATNRGIVSLQQPVSATPSQSNGKKVFIRSVTDNREFQEHPKTQDIPSLGFEGSSAASADIKKRAIARKRNSFGKAIGDILLEEDQTVESVIGNALKRSFGDLGYNVLKNEQEITADTLVVDSSIQKFWAYMTPGFWAITLSCDISTTLDIKQAKTNTKETAAITVKSEGHYQTGVEGNWMEVLHQALDKYVEQVKTKFSDKYSWAIPEKGSKR